MDDKRLVTAACLTAAFFIASLVHVPVGPSNVHLIMNGLLGILLGTAAFPAVLTALFLQSVLFQFGGLTALGVNAVILGLPAVVVGFAFRPMLQKSDKMRSVAAFCAGAGAVLLSGILAAASLAMSDQGFFAVAGTLLAAHVPVMIVEGLITVAAVSFLHKVRPDILSQARLSSFVQAV